MFNILAFISELCDLYFMIFFRRKTSQDSPSSLEFSDGEWCQLPTARAIGNLEGLNQIETCDLSISNLPLVDGPTDSANPWGLYFLMF